MIVSLRDVEAFAASYDRMRERIRREIVSAFGQPLVLGVPVDVPAPTPGENAFGFVMRVSPFLPPGTMLVVSYATLRQQADLIMERMRTARPIRAAGGPGVDDGKVRAAPVAVDADDDLVRTFLDLARAGDETTFRELAVLNGVQDVDAAWAGTVARVKRNDA